MEWNRNKEKLLYIIIKKIFPLENVLNDLNGAYKFQIKLVIFLPCAALCTQ
jgi:hypothetical protein